MRALYTMRKQFLNVLGYLGKRELLGARIYAYYAIAHLAGALRGRKSTNHFRDAPPQAIAYRCPLRNTCRHHNCIARAGWVGTGRVKQGKGP